MKNWGVIILIAGAIGLVAALGMDTSVSTGVGRVNNLGLMRDQQNYILISALAIVVGLLLAIVGPRAPVQPSVTISDRGTLRSCPDCAELIQREAKVCRFCGARELPPVEDEPALTARRPQPTLWQKLWWNPHAEPKRRSR